jgi:hypothetical protein
MNSCSCLETARVEVFAECMLKQTPHKKTEQKLHRVGLNSSIHTSSLINPALVSRTTLQTLAKINDREDLVAYCKSLSGTASCSTSSKDK